MHNNYGFNIYCIDGIPYDGEPEVEVVTVHPALTALVLILTTAGVIFAIACMIFNFVYRNRRLVVMIARFWDPKPSA